MHNDESGQLRAELENLRKAIAAQETLRGTLPDDALEVTLSTLRAKRDVLQAQLEGSGAIAQGPGATALGAGAMLVKGNIYVGPAARDDEDALRIYREVLHSTCEPLPLRGVHIGASDAGGGGLCMSLAQVYINLDTKTAVASEDLEALLAGKVPPKHRSAKAAGRDRVADVSVEIGEVRYGFAVDARETKPLPVLGAAAWNRHMVLLGDPGSGKTTFLRRLALCLASHALQPEAGWQHQLPGWPADEACALPILVTLRDFARRVPQGQPKAEPQHLLDFITERLKAQNLGFAKDGLAKALDAGEALVLLDGLDEVPTAQQRAFVRDAVEAFMKRYGRSRFVVTCRTLSYQDARWQLPAVPTFELAPFDREKIGQFIRAWYDELARLGVVRSEDAEGLARALGQAVRRPDLWRLAPTPLLLTVMALVHTHKGRLPEARALLYEDSVDILLWRWEQIKPGAEAETPRLRQLLLDAGRSDVDLKRTLGRLAFDAHAGVQADDAEALADIGEWALQKALATLHPERSLDWAQKVLEQMKQRAGLLLEREPGVYTFPHRTFQEHLAGLHLSAQADFARRGAALAGQGDLWRQVVLLAAGRLVYLSGDTDKPLALVGELCPAKAGDTELDWRKAWWAGEVLWEVGLNRVRDSALGRDLLARARPRLAALLDGARLAPVERAAAARVLGRLGDPRPGVTAATEGVPDLLWVEVPAGSFTMGEGDEQHPVTLLDFYISCYPVTNAQFDAFVRAGGYQEDRYWAEAQAAKVWREGQVQGWSLVDDRLRSAPYDYGSPYNLPNHPVVGVTWYEALAFCRWLQQQLTLAGWGLSIWRAGQVESLSLHPDAFVAQLPSEAEWEKAARGEDGCTFPWGDEQPDAERANYDDTGIGSTTAVGCFPAGRSPYGALDMAGNAWEWTRSVYSSYPYNPKDRRREELSASANKERVLRGGAFYYEGGSLRCAYRFRYSPNNLNRDLGFRVVLSPIRSGL